MPLEAIQPRVHYHIVDKLEELLELARKGEVVGLTCLVELTGGVIDVYADSQNLVNVLGHLTRQISIVNGALDKSRI
jgi:uncharacterized membrane protein